MNLAVVNPFPMFLCKVGDVILVGRAKALPSVVLTSS